MFNYFLIFDTALRRPNSTRGHHLNFFLKLEYLMQHAKFQSHRIIVLERKSFKGFNIYGDGGHRPYFSCDLDGLNVLLFPPRLKALHELLVLTGLVVFEVTFKIVSM